jgi:hypothetical protein
MISRLGPFLRSTTSAVVASAIAIALAGCEATGDAANDDRSGDEVNAKERSPSDRGAGGKAPPTEGTATTLDLGEVEPGREVTFDVPAGTLGFNVSVIGDPGWHVGIASLESPTGIAAVADFVPTGSDVALGLGSRGLSAFSVPQTDATATGPVEQGKWKLVVAGIVVHPSAPTDKSNKSLPDGEAVTGKLRVRVSLQRTNDGAFHGGELDLHVYVPEGLEVQDPDPLHAVTADTADKDPSIAHRLDIFYEELSRLFGIGRGAVAFHRIDPAFLRASTGEARASLIAQATERGPGLHVVLTNHLSYSEGDPLLGYSVGMPGAANVAATVRSAIAVALYEDQPAANDAVTFLHEMGHFVGLMHSTEDDGTPDLLADTPVCLGKGDCGDVDNLMAPMGPKNRAVVTPSQVRVVRGSPLYRAFPAAR